MAGAEWVKPFIDEIFSSKNIHSAEKMQQEKLKHINLPLYKYCYVCEERNRQEDTIDYNIENFANDELFFQNPANFNDPFDCYLGFSQMQLIKNVIIAALRKDKKYTPQARKALADIFSNDFSTSFDLSSFVEKALDDIDLETISIILSQTVEDEDVRKYLSGVLFTLLKPEHRHLFIRLIKNQLTVMDKQQVVDLLYSDENFRAYAASKITNKDQIDFILKISQRDTKLKIETNPDAFLGDSIGNNFQLADFLISLIDMPAIHSSLPELHDIKLQLQEKSDEALSKFRKIISEQCRVTCLSERMDSPLMWSHYANKHYGFCLQYDFTHTMIKRYPDLWTAQLMLFPVIYSDSRPLLSQSITEPKILLQYMKTKKMPPDIIKSILYGMLFKSQDWEYEREWRIITVGKEKPTLKLPSPRKVFLGANMEENAKEKVIEIARRKHIPVYQMFLLSDRYRFDYFEIK